MKSKVIVRENMAFSSAVFLVNYRVIALPGVNLNFRHNSFLSMGIELAILLVCSFSDAFMSVKY